MKLRPIPKSKAKTAWGLLADVKRAILAEPKRADMGVFRRTVRPEHGGPACGTVGCFAGWVTLLHNPRWPAPPSSVWEPSPIANKAHEILGEGCNFYTVPGPDDYVFNSGDGDACQRTRAGTKAHARAVVARIDKFMRVNAKVLKAKKV